MSQLVVEAKVAQNPRDKMDHHVMYSSILFNFDERHYTTIERKFLAMVYACYGITC